MEFSSIRAKRVINAFIGCVKQGVYTFDYAVTLIENTEKYGYLTGSDKECFYSEFEAEESEEIANENIS